MVYTLVVSDDLKNILGTVQPCYCRVVSSIFESHPPVWSGH